MTEEKCEHCDEPEETEHPCGYCCGDHDLEIVRIHTDMRKVTPLSSFYGELQCNYCNTIWLMGANPE